MLLLYRNFKRFKSTFLINLIGLSTGLACALLIYLWISDERSFDHYHALDGRLYQVLENRRTAAGIANPNRHRAAAGRGPAAGNAGD